MRIRRISHPPSGRLSRLLHSRRARWIAGLALAAMVAGAAWLIWPFWQLSGQFDDHPARQPSRLYARPLELTVGEPFRPDAVVADLQAQGYRELEGGGGLPPGTFRQRDGGSLSVHLRRYPTPLGFAGNRVLQIEHNGRRVRRLVYGEREVPRVLLEPVLLASYFGPDLQERRPVRLADMPEELIWAVLAAEDENFFSHGGLSVTGIARAAWVNLRGGTVRQGGSTLTQQLVKNLYLTHERTLSRKVREAVLALLLELRYTKEEILQAYLNEIYMGASNGVSLMGVGSAARAYFGKQVGELTLGEAATLGGVIQSPANTMPTARPEAARERRDWVLDRMVEEGFLEAERAAAAKEREVEVHPVPVVRRRAPWFADQAAREAAERFGLESLDDAGYLLLSTLDAHDQREAREAVAWGVEALEEGWERRRKAQGAELQAALVSLDPETGGIRAYVGGRSYEGSQFDRAGRALRQTGSAFKPVVYAAAFEDDLAYPAAFVEDAPLTVRQASGPWSPQNSDDTFHGWVTVRTAVEESLNVATARMALQVGLERVVEMARDLGVETPMQPVPAIALGAFEVTPLQLATVYATFAAGGERPPVHALDAVLDPRGRAVDGEELPEPERVISPETAYLITSVLQGVLDRGTGVSARRQGVRGPLAGKTGTSNDRRDSWFSGYSPHRVSTVWVGYDDNRATSLSGARAALPIWSRFTMAVVPRGGYPVFSQPPGIATAVIDPTTGLLATDDCPVTLTEVYPAGDVPTEVCSAHGGWGWGDRDRRRDDDRRDDDRHPFRRWLERIFGGDDEEGRERGGGAV